MILVPIYNKLKEKNQRKKMKDECEIKISAGKVTQKFEFEEFEMGYPDLDGRVKMTGIMKKNKITKIGEKLIE